MVQHQKRSQYDFQTFNLYCKGYKGQLFNESNLRVIRPGYGCSPKFYEGLIGKQAKKDFIAGTPLHIKDIF